MEMRVDNAEPQCRLGQIKPERSDGKYRPARIGGNESAPNSVTVRTGGYGLRLDLRGRSIRPRELPPPVG